jgi:hypothetical protein
LEKTFDVGQICEAERRDSIRPVQVRQDNAPAFVGKMANVQVPDPRTVEATHRAEWPPCERIRPNASTAGLTRIGYCIKA